MLPVETFADVVSFLGYYDLGGLKLSSRLFSAVVNECADATRVFDFSDFAFHMYNSAVEVYRIGPSGDYGPWVCRLQFSSERALAEFVSEAFRNCTVGSIVLWTRREHVLHATKFVAKTTVVADTLTFYLDVFENERKGIDFVDSFRRVERLKIRKCWATPLVDKKSMEAFCQRKNIVLVLEL